MTVLCAKVENSGLLLSASAIVSALGEDVPQLSAFQNFESRCVFIFLLVTSFCICRAWLTVRSLSDPREQTSASRMLELELSAC